METRFLRPESPPEGRAKYRNNIPPTVDLMGWSRMVCRIRQKWENDGVVVFLSCLGRC